MPSLHGRYLTDVNCASPSCQSRRRGIGPRSNFKKMLGVLETRTKRFPYPLVADHLARTASIRCGPSITLANIMGSLNQFVLVAGMVE